MEDAVRYPDVVVPLVDELGVACEIVGRVSGAIAALHGDGAARAWVDEATDSGTYGALLLLVLRSVRVNDEPVATCAVCWSPFTPFEWDSRHSDVAGDDIH